MINVGIIGPGTFGQTQINVFQGLKNAQVVAISGNTPDKVATIAEKYGIPQYTTNFSELLQNSKIDVISIATPNHLHKELFLEALKYDKHIIIEKPVALNFADAKEMLAAAEGFKKLIMVDHPTRFNPVTEKIREFKKSGELGELRFVQINSYTDYVSSQEKTYSWYDNSQKGGGQTLNMGTHLIDLTRFLLGMPKFKDGTLHAKTVIEKYPDNKIPDVEQQVSAQISWENNADSNFFNTTTSFGYKGFELRVIGTKGAVYYDDVDGLLFADGKNQLKKILLVDNLQDIQVGKSFVSKSFKYFADWLIKYLHNETPGFPFCTLKEAAENLEILEKIKK